MIISRAIFGLGGENLTITASAFVSQWFKGKELAFALGVDISAARLAATLNDSIQPILYKTSGNYLHLGYMIGVILAFYSILCAVSASLVDMAADSSDNAEKKINLLRAENDERKEEDDEEVRLSDIRKFSMPFWLVSLNCLFFYMPYFSLLNVLSELMQDRFSISIMNAGFLMVFCT